MPSPTWKGSTAIALQPRYPKFKRTAKGATLTLSFRGPTSALKTYGPDIGDAITLGAFDYAPSDEVVVANSIECEPDGAGDDGPGTLTVVYSNEADAGGLLVGSTTTIEIDYNILEKPLIQHPRYTTGGAKALTDDDRSKINRWKEAPSSTLYASLSGNAQDFVDKLKKGIESYIIGAPVARKTTRNTTPPTVSSVGDRSTTAPITGAPSGYQWVKTADRAIRQAPASGWERVEEWTGSKTADADIYGSVI